jgi:tetratricopeptide (TPR) repeat protein
MKQRKWRFVVAGLAGLAGWLVGCSTNLNQPQPTQTKLLRTAPPPLTPEQKKERFRQRVRDRLQYHSTMALRDGGDMEQVAGLMSLAKMDADLGNDEEAIESLEAVIRLVPESQTALYAIALYYSRLLQFAQGEKRAKELIRLAPQNPDGYIALSWVYYRAGRKADAAAALRKGTERTDLSEEARFRIAVQHTKLHDPSAAAIQLQKIVAARPDFQPAWAFLGAVRIGLSQTAEAQRCLEKAIALNNNDPRAHLLLAQVLLESKSVDEARQHLERTLALDPNDFEAHLRLASLLQRQQKWAEAAKGYAAALRLNPEHLQARYAFARVCSRLGQRDVARKHQAIYRALRERELERTRLMSDADARPPSLSAFLALSRFHARNGDYAEAIEWAQKACSIAPKDAEAQRDLKRILAEARWEGANQ